MLYSKFILNYLLRLLDSKTDSGGNSVVDSDRFLKVMLYCFVLYMNNTIRACAIYWLMCFFPIPISSMFSMPQIVIFRLTKLTTDLHKWAS